MRQNTDLPTLFQGFRLYCLAEGKQPTSIRWYLGKLRLFLSYLEDETLPTDAARLTTTHLRAFLVHLREDARADEDNPMKPMRERGLSPKSIQGYARTLEVFFSWLAREGHVTSNPARLLRIPTAPKTIVETVSDPQISRLLSVTDRGTTKGFRDYCIILILLDTGIRLSELVSLKVRDLDL